MGIPLEHIGIFLREHLLGDGLAHHLADFAIARPDVLEKDLLSALVHAERLLQQVGIHRASERVGDDQRRRGKIIRAHVGVHATLEVAVAGQNGGRDQILVVDRLGNLGSQRPRIAYAGCAAKAHEIVPELIELLLQPRFAQILRHDLRSRRQGGFDPGLHRQPLGHRLTCKQSRPDHDTRVRCVCAGGDRGDHHIAVPEIMISALDRNTAGCAGLCKILVERGRKRWVQVKDSFSPSPSLPNSFSIAVAKPDFTSLRATRSCGRFGPASEGSTSSSSSLSTSVKTDPGSTWCGTCPAPWRKPLPIR